MEVRVQDLRWINSTIQQTRSATHHQWRVAAMIVRSGRVLSIGVNRYRNNPARVSRDSVSYHAEEVALRRAGNVEGSTIYVARVTRSGLLGLAMPCARCQELLLDRGVSTAVWTDVEGIGKSKLQDLTYTMDRICL